MATGNSLGGNTGAESAIYDCLVIRCCKSQVILGYFVAMAMSDVLGRLHKTVKFLVYF